MSCKNCSKKIHPIFIALAIIAWILIICTIIKILWIIEFTILFWLGIACLILKLCHSAADADDWCNKIKKIG